jgi:hypothetical protein
MPSKAGATFLSSKFSYPRTRSRETSVATLDVNKPLPPSPSGYGTTLDRDTQDDIFMREVPWGKECTGHSNSASLPSDTRSGVEKHEADVAAVVKAEFDAAQRAKEKRAKRELEERKKEDPDKKVSDGNAVCVPTATEKKEKDGEVASE